MTEGILLDTSAAILHFRDELDLAELPGADFGVFLPLIAAGELYEGAYRSARPKHNLLQIEKLLERASLQQPDQTALEKYGLIAAALAKLGRPIPLNDMWIAAMALATDLPLVARDDHFSRIDGLRFIPC